MQAEVACTGPVHTRVASIHSYAMHDGLDVASYAWLHIAEFVDSPSSPNTIPKLPIGYGLMGSRHRLQVWQIRACKHAVNRGVSTR